MKNTISNEISVRVEDVAPDFMRSGSVRGGKYDAVVKALTDLDFVKWVVLGPFKDHESAEIGRGLRQLKAVKDLEISRQARLVTRIASQGGKFELWLCWMRLEKTMLGDLEDKGKA